MTLYEFAYIVSKMIFSIVTFRTPLKAYGKENIPAGGAVICSNHVHNSDPFYIVYSFHRKDKIWIMAKEEIRHYPVVGRLLNWLGFVIWVRRGKSDVGAIKSALKALKGKEKLLIFPEGTRHEEIGEGKTGSGYDGHSHWGPRAAGVHCPGTDPVPPDQGVHWGALQPFTENPPGHSGGL